MELSHQDALRLNILLSQNINAIRINESKMTLHALLEDKEVTIPLSPNGNEDRYLKTVREFLSYKILNSPAGYPIFLKRWSRTGELQSEKLRELLKIAEPEAVIAVAHSNHLTDELARYVWWSTPSVEIARQMLLNPMVCKSELSAELSDFLYEFLPFEESHENIIQTVTLLLKNSLVDDSKKSTLWKKGKRKTSYYIGFLHAIPENIPENYAAHTCHKNLSTISHSGNIELSAHDFLCKLFSSKGQNFLQTCAKSILGITDQDALVSLFNAIKNYFAPLNVLSTQQLLATLNELLANNVLTNKQIEAISRLSKISEDDLTHILAQTNAIGSLLRKKASPVTDVILQDIKTLCSDNP